MARPKRCNADYFSHDVHMRNDIKIKAVRRKYGHKGYSIWIMLLEHLGNSDYFEYEWNELNIELLTPDFDVESEELSEIVNYFIKLDLIQFKNGFIHCENLTARLMEYLQKNREGFDMGNSLREKGNHSLPSSHNSLPTDNICLPSVNIDEVSDNTDTKVNKTKLNQSELNESKVYETKVEYTKPNETDIKIARKKLDEIVDLSSSNNTELARKKLADIEIDYTFGLHQALETAFPNDTAVQNNYKKHLLNLKIQ